MVGLLKSDRQTDRHLPVSSESTRRVERGRNHSLALVVWTIVYGLRLVSLPVLLARPPFGAAPNRWCSATIINYAPSQWQRITRRRRRFAGNTDGKAFPRLVRFIGNMRKMSYPRLRPILLLLLATLLSTISPLSRCPMLARQIHVHCRCAILLLYILYSNIMFARHSVIFADCECPRCLPD